MEGGDALGRGVGGEDSDGGEQEGRSPMATGNFCQIQVSKLRRDTQRGKWSVIAIINVISVSKLQTSLCHPCCCCCWRPASTAAAWERRRWEYGRRIL